MATYAQTAVDGTGRDAGVPWHYGDPFAEQRATARTAGVVDRRTRDVIQVPGEDRLGWLHSICSQHLTGLADGDVTEALVLSPNGHVEQHWQLAEIGGGADGTVWIDTEPGEAAQVLGYLTKMRFLKRVEPSDVSTDWAVLSVVGPTTAAVLAAAGLPVPERVGRAVALDGGGYLRRMPARDDAADLVVPAGRTDALFALLVGSGATPAGLWAYEAARVESVTPRLGAETDHRTIPHELGWIGPAVHLDKGCYRGQETVARVQNLGRPPRKLVFAHLGGESDELPPPGSPVDLDGRTVGFLGTAVQHHELGPIALAVVKRSLPDDAHLQVNGISLAVDPSQTPARAD